jgi:hypothetical protein
MLIIARQKFERTQPVSQSGHLPSGDELTHTPNHELCDLVGVPRPDPAGSGASQNRYTFERVVTHKEAEGTTPNGFITTNSIHQTFNLTPCRPRRPFQERRTTR